MRRILIAIIGVCSAVTFQGGCGSKLSVVRRAAELARKERYEEAIQAYERFIEMAGDSPSSAYEQAEAYFQIGCLYTYHLTDPWKGRSAFEQAVALRPDYADPQVHLGIMYMIQSEEDEQRLRRAIQDRARLAQIRRLQATYKRNLLNSEVALRRALESQPEITDYAITPNIIRRPRVILADLEQQRRRLNEAIRQLYTYEHYSDDDPEDWRQLGAMFLRQQEYSEALFYYARAFETLDGPQRAMPRYLNIRLGLIDAYTANGYLAEAQEILNESSDILSQIARYYKSLQSWQQSEETDRLGVQIVEWQRRLLQQQFRIYAHQANHTNALAALRELRNKAPDAEVFLLNLAETYGLAGDFEAAYEHLEMFRHLAYGSPQSLRVEAVILHEERRYDACLKRLDDYIALAPDDLDTRANKGLVLVKAGKVAEGIAYVEEQCRQHPNLSPIQLVMAETHAAAGQPDRALWWLRRAMETGLVVPFVFQTHRELAPLLDQPGFPEFLKDVRYKISLRQRVHEAENLLYRWETERGLAALERLRAQNPDILFTAYALARGYVFAGKIDEAYPLLMQCAKGGFFNPDALREDAYLTELHGDPRFLDLLNAIEQPWPTNL